MTHPWRWPIGFVFLFGFGLACAPGVGSKPAARAGVFELDDAASVMTIPVALDGEWDFFWNELLTPADFAAGRRAGSWIKVPGMWNDHRGPAGPVPGVGFATLRLVVRADRFPEGLALKVPTMHTAFSLYANGRVVAANGQVGTTRETSLPAYRPLLVELPPATNSIELILQISNFHHRKGGTWAGIRLGGLEHLRQEHLERVQFDLFLFGSLLVMGFYHLMLYLFRRGDASPLYLGLFFLLMVLRIMSTGEHYLSLWFPMFPWEPYVKIQYLSFYLAIVVWTFFVKKLYPDEIMNFYIQAALWPVAVCTAIVLVTPVRVYSYTMPIMEVYTIVMGLLMFVILIMVLLRRRRGALLFLIGWAGLFGGVVNDILVNRETIQGVLLLHLGVFVFALMQSALLSQRFSLAFGLAERSTETLEAGIRERTAELKRSRDELSDARDRAEDSSRAKSEFLAAMSHEIRTPLNSILGTAGLLRESELGAEQRRQVDILNRAGAKLLNLVNEVLDLSRIEAGKQILEDVPYDPIDLCEELLAILDQRAREKGIDLSFKVSPDFPRAVMGDPIRLEQILLNLLGNAIKFTERGSIELALQKKATTLGEPCLEYSVSDTGVGIAVDKMPLIFESFMQVDQAASRRYEGSGLGLAICKRLVELMGGTISVSSRPGRGSEFRFAIPFRSPGTRVPVIQRKIPEALPRPGARVLLVEDNEDNRYLIQAYLAKTGVLLDFASEGRSAVEAAQTKQYDLILMDIQMPIMDGYEATRVIRSWEEEVGHPPVPIIALTANATLEAVRKSSLVGCNDHLTKPVARDRLLETIARYAGEAEEKTPRPI